MTINKVILIGNLGQDPEEKKFNNGGSVVNLSVATSERWKNKDTGERQERTEWHRVAVFNDKLHPMILRYLKKGSKVYLEGQLETRKWQDQSGQDRYMTEIVLRPFKSELKLMEDPLPQQAPNQQSDQRNQGSQSRQNNQRNTVFYDDEIPF